MSERVRIWELPIRLFHWALAALVVCSFATGMIGGNWVVWHFRSGYAILALVLFRVIWGFAGGRYTRFAAFPPSPTHFIAYLRAPARATSSPGHNPLGSLSVYALLGLVGLQAITGLFANDDIASEGPWVKYISKSLSDQLTSLHHLNKRVILALVILHLAAILYYRLRKAQDLVGPMLTGDKVLDDPRLAARDDAGLRARALGILVAVAIAVWLAVI